MAGVPVENASGTTIEVALTQTTADVGYASITSEADAGVVSGAKTLLPLEASDDYRLRVGTDTPAFALNFEGTSIPRAHIQQNLTSFTAAQASGFLSINSGNDTTNNHSGDIRTYRTFALGGPFSAYCEMQARHANSTATSAITEWGFGYVATTSAPTDGAFFRIASGGALTAVINFAGSETASSAISTTNLINRDGTSTFDFAKVQHYLVSVGFDSVRYWINNVLVATIPVPSAQPLATSANAQPIFARVYNTGAASAARRFDLGFLSASGADASNGRPWPHIVAGFGGGGYQVQPGGTSGQTATYAASAAPSAGTYTNQTAPATNTLGGLWLSVSPLPVASENDYPLFTWQNPVGTATLPGKTFYCTGIRVGETYVTVILGVSATILTWAIAVGSTGATLATTDAAATVGPRRIALGAQGFAITAAVGTTAPGFHVPFTAPLVVPPGCYLHVINRFLLNAATGVLRGSVGIDGYFE